MPRKVIIGEHNPNPKLVKGRDFHFFQAVQREYDIWFAQTKLKQLDGLAKRLAKQTVTHMRASREAILREYASKRIARGKLPSLNPLIRQVDSFIIGNLRVTQEQKTKAMQISDVGNKLSTFWGQGILREHVSKKEFVEVAQQALGYYSLLSNRRKEELTQAGFLFEKIKAQVDKISRSGAKEYLANTNLTLGLKTIVSGYVWEILGDDAAYIYKHAYAQAKEGVFLY